jgi:pimeloyl-ACP methyl ester carboxylesterase
MVAVMLSVPLHAQDIVGIWQAHAHSGSQSARVVMSIPKPNEGRLSPKFYILEQGAEPLDVWSVSLHGSEIEFKLGEGRFVGTVSTDGASLTGTWWISRQVKIPLDFQRATKDTAWTVDSSAHTSQLVTVDKGVQLEVLDWGGTGRQLIFLAGLGNTAHVFDGFAPKFTGAYHVYGITRRGYGASSAPHPEHDNYSADRLGDDVLAVIDALKLDHPVLAGHSIAGEELSSIGSRHPEKVAGLIYLDAGWPFAYVSNAKKHPQPLEYWLATLDRSSDPADRIEFAIDRGEESYTTIRCPVLAIYAFPHPHDTVNDKKAELKQIDAFQSGIPGAQVVKLPNATHYLFLSNQADVVREMNSFMAKLPL